MIYRRSTNQQVQECALALIDCLAKTSIQNNEKCEGRSVLEHCLIVGEIARSLMKRMPHWLREALFPVGTELIAAAHDVGKICPTFQEKMYRNIIGYVPNSLRGLKGANPDWEKNWGYHAGVSHLTVQACSVGQYIPEIIGQHHGFSPNLVKYQANDEFFGGDPWQVRREELIAELKGKLNCDWPKVMSSLQARVLAGLTTVSDWVGSGSIFDDPSEPWKPYIDSALDSAGFVKPELRNHLSFAEIFGFEPRNAQHLLIQNCNRPGVYILEAPMGLGKTEAALYSAYQALIGENATGIYFALPTQLTSDKIRDRMDQFLDKILEPTCRHRRALLLHSNAWLKETEMGEDGQPGGSWFQSGKRGILAPFAVGTIDQALMAVMNIKHGFVRTFGLAGKVVILDEVHSYDAYTGTILDKLVEGLRELHCTVIILSATLTRQRRQSLLDQDLSFENHYPLITVSQQNKKLQEIPGELIPDVEVIIKLFSGKDNQAVEESLLRAEQGQQVLWIENTVAEAQVRYKLLAAKSAERGIECGLLHSRFLKYDRDNIEQHWISLLGKNNNDQRCLKGRILVGTQILEQSLDIDADFLVSRICPTDMLLQRLGRLWRHKGTIRPKTAAQEAWILAPMESDRTDPMKDFGNTARIYSPYVLYRSLQVWAHLQSVVLPSQIRHLIEATYKEDPSECDIMLRHKAKLEIEKEKLAGLARVGLSQGLKTLPECKAGTRHSEQDTVEVLLLQAYCHDEKHRGVWITLLNGERIYLPRNGKAQKKKAWRKLAITLKRNTVRVAEYFAPTALPKEQLEGFKDYLYLGSREQGESLLRVAKILKSGELLALNSGKISADYRLNYDNILGYQAKKLKRKT